MPRGRRAAARGAVRKILFVNVNRSSTGAVVSAPPPGPGGGQGPAAPARSNAPMSGIASPSQSLSWARAGARRIQLAGEDDRGVAALDQLRAGLKRVVAR